MTPDEISSTFDEISTQLYLLGERIDQHKQELTRRLDELERRLP